MWIIIYIWLFDILWSVQAANILILHPLYVGSHTIVLQQFGDYLVSRGHHVTQVKFRESNSKLNPNTKVEVIDLPARDPTGQCWNFINSDGEFDLGIAAANMFWEKGSSMKMLPPNVFCIPRTHCDSLFNSKVFADKMNSTKFDVALVDLFTNECGLAYVRSLNIPVAGFWGWSFTSSEVGHTSVMNLPSHVPATFSGLHAVMNFRERIVNFVLSVTHKVLMEILSMTTQEKVSKKFPDLPPVSQMVHDIDLHLVNANFMTDSARLLTPNTIHIGGPQLRPGKPPPKVTC